MANYQQEQAALLEQYCAALAQNLQAIPPAGLDAQFVSLAHRLYQQAVSAEPSSTFAWRLEQRLAAAHTLPVAQRPNPAARPMPAAARRFPIQSWLMPRLATAIMLALLVVGAALLAGILSGRNPAVGNGGNSAFASPTPQLPSVDQLRGNAAAALKTSQIQSFVMTDTARVAQDPSHLGNLIGKPITAPGGGNVTGSRTTLFQSPNLWRIEGKGTLAAATQSPSEKQYAVEVSDGTTLSNYESASNVVTIASLDTLNNVKGSPSPLEGVLGNNYSLSWLTDNCYHPSVSGVDTVAGRAVYVIDLGGYYCFADTTSFAQAIWVDQQTYFVLRIVTYDQRSTSYGITEATGVQYNVPIDAATFTFTPPPGAKVYDYRNGKMNTQVLQQKLGQQMLEVAAKALGLSSVDALRSELAKGNTIAGLAKMRGISEKDLIATVVKAIKPQLDSLVEAGQLTQQDEDSFIQQVQATDLGKPLNQDSFGGATTHVPVTTPQPAPTNSGTP